MTSDLLPFDSPWMLAAGLAAAGTAIVIAAVRRLRAARAAKALVTVGLLLLALAAGEPTWHRPLATEVAVMVDLSASTRGAAYRDRAALTARIQQLLGSTPFRIYRFAQGQAIPDAGGSLDEIPSDSTIFMPPPAGAVLLFSDGQFPLPVATPPTYAVIDPGLAAAADARIGSLKMNGADVVAEIASKTPGRALQWSGVQDAAAADAVLPGTYVQRRKANAAAPSVVARLTPGDRWPENDELAIHPPPPLQSERWFVSEAAATPPGFKAIRPSELPADASAYLAPSVIVVDNLPADSLTPSSRDRLGQYTRELGGGLVLLGGDRAFAAGGYTGTQLDSLSPLASTPPRPATNWIFLTDASGSMKEDADGRPGGANKWQVATDALVQLLPSLPPDDPVDLGSFAADVSWWSVGRSAKATRALALPPANVSPGGVTNLQSAIEEAARRHDPALPGELLVLTDADADLTGLPALTAMLKSHRVKLNILAVENGKALADLREVARQTGGQVVTQSDSARWATSAADLLRAATDKHLFTDAAAVTFLRPFAAAGSRRTAGAWNRTWIKPAAAEVAQTTHDNESLPMAATWQIGEGRVAAIAFRPTAAEIEALASLVSRPPHDPSLAVEWEVGKRLHVRIDAIDPSLDSADPFLNGRSFTLDVAQEEASPRTAELMETAPGRYELDLPAPTRPALATLREGGRAIDRYAVAGRYAAEFDVIGIDRDRLTELASRTRGRVIEPDDIKPIDFRWPRQEISITSWFAAAGAAFIAAGLLWWRWR